MINRFFLKKFEFNAVVLLQFVDRGDMAEILLRNVVIIEIPILLQGRFQVASGDERGAFQDLGDAAVEAFDHAVGLGVMGFDEAMVDAVGGTGLVEDVLAGGRALAGGAEAVGELFAVVGQHAAKDERPLSAQALQETGGVRRFVRPNLKVDSAAGPIDGRDQITVFGLVGHLGQVFDVDVHEARLVVFEGLG